LATPGQKEPENAWQMIDRLYTDDFIADIAKRFKIQLDPTELARELRDIGSRYIAANRAEKLDDSRQARADYKGRLRIITKFQQDLWGWADDDMAGLMADAARISAEPLPTTDFPDLNDHQRRRGDAYYHELLRLVEVAKTSTQLAVKRLTSDGGRPINSGLEILTRRAADLWCEILKRSFTLDYHKGSGVTDAFCFVKALLKPIAAIPDLKIITAIRAEISRRRRAPAGGSRG
jgi:hypothetical protein